MIAVTGDESLRCTFYEGWFDVNSPEAILVERLYIERCICGSCKQQKDIHDLNHPTLKEAGVDIWGEYCLKQQTGIHDLNHPALKEAGVDNWSAYSQEAIREGIMGKTQYLSS